MVAWKVFPCQFFKQCIFLDFIGSLILLSMLECLFYLERFRNGIGRNEMISRIWQKILFVLVSWYFMRPFNYRAPFQDGTKRTEATYAPINVDLSCDAICIFLWNAPYSRTFVFRLFSHFQINHVFFPRNVPPPFARESWNALFPLRFLELKKGISKISNILKVGQFEVKTRDQFKTEKQPKINDSGVFQRKLQMPSHDKYGI